MAKHLEFMIQQHDFDINIMVDDNLLRQVLTNFLKRR